MRRHPRAYALLCVECHRLFDHDILHPPSRGLGWRCDRLERADVRSILFVPAEYAFGEEQGNGESGPFAVGAWAAFEAAIGAK